MGMNHLENLSAGLIWQDAVGLTTKLLGEAGGAGIAHTFLNTGTVPFTILDVGTVEPEDACYYPNEKGAQP